MSTDGDDSLDGGAGNDSIVATGVNDTLRGGAGDDTLEGGADNDLLIGGSGNDSLSGGTGDDTFFGDGINEVTVAVGGSSRNGVNPEYEVYADGVLIFTGEVTWAQDGTSSFDPNAPGAFQDVTVPLPNGAPDSIEVRFTNNSVPGDNGTSGDRNLHLDSITVGDTTYQAETDATISNGFAGSQDANLFITGSSATFDTTSASPMAGNDTMEGGDGADTFILGDSFGNDSIVGGEGGTDFDVIDLSALSGAVTVTFTDEETGTITDGIDTITFSQIENIILTDQSDSVDASVTHDGVFGDVPGVNIDARDGDDTIIGGRGGDTISGGDGNDSIDGDYGDDSIDGGAGNDTLSGGSGNDTLSGGDGNDSIIGGPGDDSIDGGTQADTLIGSFGNDTIRGGDGDDVISGGSGNDTFIYDSGDGVDMIVDFNSGNTGTLDDGDSTNNDFIDLSAYYDHISELYADQADDGVLNQSNALDSRGNSVDYADNAQFGAGALRFTTASADESSFTRENTGVVCFIAGTMIRTPRGPVPIEHLRAGDYVNTMDNGPQPVVWVGRRDLTFAELADNPKLRPIHIAPDVTGGQGALIVSPQHGILLKTCDGDQRLVRATHLARMDGGKARVMQGCRAVSYLHLMFEAHQIIFANGAPAESFYPGPNAFAALPQAARREVMTLFPALDPCMTQRSYGATARGLTPWRALPAHLRDLSHAPH